MKYYNSLLNSRIIFFKLHTHEKQIKTAHNEIDALAYRLEQQKQKAYTKIFKDYIPTLETDPSDLLKNFLSS